MKKLMLATIIAGASILYSCKPATEKQELIIHPDTLYFVRGNDTTMYVRKDLKSPQEQEKQEETTKNWWQQLNDYAVRKDSTRAATIQRARKEYQTPNK